MKKISTVLLSLLGIFLMSHAEAGGRYNKHIKCGEGMKPYTDPETKQVSCQPIQPKVERPKPAPVATPTVTKEEPIAITKVEPSQGRVGTPLKIYTKNMQQVIDEYSNRGTCQISIGGIDASDFVVMSSNLDLPVQRTVPGGAKNGEIAIQCQKRGVGVVRSSSGNLFQLIDSTPQITSIYPNGGVEQNNQISIFGSNLSNAKEVTFNGTKGNININNPDQIRVIVPRIDGNTKIIVATPQGNAVWDNYMLFKTKPPADWKPMLQPVAEKPKVTVPPPAQIPDLGKVNAGVDASKLTNGDPLTANTGGALTNSVPLTNGVPLIGNAGSAFKDKDKVATLPGGNALTQGAPLAGNAGSSFRTQAIVPGSVEQKGIVPAASPQVSTSVQETTKGKIITKTITTTHSDGSISTDSTQAFEPKPEYEAVDAALKEAFVKHIELNSKLYPTYEEWLLDPAQPHYKRALELYKKGNLKREVVDKNLAFGNENGIFDNLWNRDKTRKSKLSGACSNTPIAEAYKKVLGRLPNGVNNNGECLPEYYLDIPTALPSFDKLVLNVKKRNGINTKMVITDFEPKEGGTNTRVTLKGENLGNATLAVLGCNLANAKQNDPHCLRIVIAKISDKKVEVQMMPKMNAVAPIILFSPTDGYVPTLGNFSCYLWPEIRQIVPANPRPGEIVELRGENLFALTAVVVAGKSIRLPEGNHLASEGNSLNIKLPENAPTEGVINVATKGGHTWISYKLGLILPYISRVEPAKARPGDVVSLYGEHLGHFKNILIGKETVRAVGKGDDNSVLVTVPNSPAGKYEVTVNGFEGSGKWENRLEILGVPIAKKPAPPKIIPQPALLPPPPPPQTPEVAVRHEPQEEPMVGHCERGTWSPTLRTCIEDQVQEVVAPPDCGAGAHWSPTLKSCQSD